MQTLQLEILKFIQSFSSPFLDKIFVAITIIGEETFYILAFCVIYWCYDKMLGKKLSLTFLFGDCLNASLKELFHVARPIGIESVRTLRAETATGYSFPSGHTQSTATFFYFWSNKVKKIWFAIVAWIIIVLVAFSRLYLGVHWPADVVCSVLLAVAVVHFGNWFFEKTTALKLLISIVLINALLLVFTSKGYVTAAAVFTSGFLGMFIEQKYVKYEIQKKLLNNIIKFILGIAVVFAIKIGIKALLPSLLIFDYIRYFLIGIWVSLGAMTIFKKLKI